LPGPVWEKFKKTMRPLDDRGHGNRRAKNIQARSMMDVLEPLTESGVGMKVRY
jgi:hypothetical protein